VPAEKFSLALCFSFYLQALHFFQLTLTAALQMHREGDKEASAGPDLLSKGGNETWVSGWLHPPAHPSAPAGMFGT